MQTSGKRGSFSNNLSQMDFKAFLHKSSRQEALRSFPGQQLWGARYWMMEVLS